MKLQGLASFCICLLMAGASHAQGVVLRYTEWLPPTYFMNVKGLYPYFADIERVTEGRVKVEVSAAPLGPPPRNYQLAMDGIADLAWGLHGYTPGTFPLSELVELPFHSTNAKADSVAYWNVYKQYFEPTGMHPGVHTLTVHVQPPGQLFNSKHPIASAADFAGLKIRATNSGVSDSLSRLGATPVGLPVTEMREAMEKGIVDGVSLTDEALFNFRISDFIHYKLEIPGGLYNASMFLVMNEAAWNSISPADQAAISAISGERLAAKLGSVWQDEQDAALAKAKSAGIQTSAPDGPFLADIHAKLDDLEAAWLSKAKAAGVDAEGALKAYQAASKAGAN